MTTSACSYQTQADPEGDRDELSRSSILTSPGIRAKRVGLNLSLCNEMRTFNQYCWCRRRNGSQLTSCAVHSSGEVFLICSEHLQTCRLRSSQIHRLKSTPNEHSNWRASPSLVVESKAFQSVIPCPFVTPLGVYHVVPWTSVFIEFQSAQVFMSAH